MKHLITTLLTLTSTLGMAQKIFTEGIVEYRIEILKGAENATVASAFSGATQTLYIKSYRARLDFKSNLRNQSTVYDAQDKKGFILKQNGTEKYLLPLENENWQKYHQRYLGVSFTKMTDTKQIAGYTCLKAVGKMKDGAEVVVYYCPELKPLAVGYDPLFETLDGLPMEYQLGSNGVLLSYTTQSVQATMVAAGLFELPKTGYKVLEFAQR
jgi:GLPGLI family protein